MKQIVGHRPRWTWTPMSPSAGGAVEQGEPLTAGQQTPRGPSVRLLLGGLPFAVMVAVATADLLAGPAFGLLPLLSLGPALAAVSLSPMRTALVGGLGAVMCLPLDDLCVGMACGHETRASMIIV